ncbi:MAG: MmcQ/YjbR family DNA-binding protein [Tepidibacter sp.]|jgi:predicted DNA-binding protein (MmcQ/YjbR family)|uniref:MmcQ/YjbR family DNA-binding protein n=1 Tax=Tepidibacter sp. TaxID=2529387 RepID=UPI0025EEFF04|nr:MmcQ/YjbR family DNA-binding protein [Tepidibacter sp.]MCT4508557.1 MmcQ/YjbR family DNA-binding protein [Tepidibacter sp.]
MKYEWIDKYCMSKAGVEKDFKIEWDAIRYLVGRKMFAMQGEDKDKKTIITLKCEPSFGQFLREQYQHIVAGYYMNKQHWNSVYLDGDVPDDILKQMIDMSYQLVLNSLSKKIQKKIIVSQYS